MEISKMGFEEIETRKAEIHSLLEKDDITLEDITKLNTEVDELEARKVEIEKSVETRKELLEKVAKTEDVKVLEKREKGDDIKMEKTFDLNSKEFRSAYWKTLADEALTVEERAAYTHTTANYGGALPAETVREIWSLIEENHALLGDITTYRTGTVLELTVHEQIQAGDAATVAEGAARADDEKNKFAKVTLSGKDFSKHVEVSYALGKMTAGALEQYLVGEIADRLGVALNADVIAQIGTDMTVGNKVDVATAKKLTFKDVAGAFALVKGKGQNVVYANSKTIYNYIATLEDTGGRLIFQPDANAGVNGYLLGAAVKEDEGIADNVLLIGKPKDVVGNFIQDVLIEQERDIKRHVEIYAGYARFECKLVNPDAFAELTVKQA